MGIYIIINYENSKVYIGKTNNIKTRSLDYINNYCKGYLDRKIDRAFNSIGIENFLMSPLEVAFNQKSASIKEKYYIDLYNSVEEGYNVSYGCENYSKPNKNRRKGVKQTIYAKMAKSKLICAINPDDKCIFFSTGLKLFGDFVGRGKDEIKSAARRETKIEGYFIYYMNQTDFNYQIENANMRIEMNSIYKDNLLQYNDFVKYSNYLLSYLRDNTVPDDFEIKSIIQSNNESGYDYISIDNFLKYYQSTKNNIQ